MSETTVKNNESQAGSAKKVSNQTRSRLTMIAFFMVFFGPIFLAMFLYSNLDIWRPANTKNHGELMLPIAPLSHLNLVDNESNNPVTLDTIKDHWTLIYIGKDGCDLSCEANLFKVRQMRILLGKEIDRVQYLFLALDLKAAKAADELASEHPRLARAIVSADLAEKQAAAFGENPAGNIYLVDPLGNLVLRYGKDAEARGILKDMHRLLRVSKIG